MHHVRSWRPWWSEECSYRCELPCGCWDSSPTFQEKQPAFLFAEPSLQAQTFFFHTCFILFYFAETVFLCAALAVLELILQTMQVETQRSACLYLLSAGIKGLCHHCQARFIYFYFLCILPPGTSTPGACSSWRDQKRAWDSLALEWQVVVSHSLWLLGIEDRSSSRAASTLNYKVISPGLASGITVYTFPLSWYLSDIILLHTV